MGYHWNHCVKCVTTVWLNPGLFTCIICECQLQVYIWHSIEKLILQLGLSVRQSCEGGQGGAYKARSPRKFVTMERGSAWRLAWGNPWEQDQMVGKATHASPEYANGEHVLRGVLLHSLVASIHLPFPLQALLRINQLALATSCGSSLLIVSSRNNPISRINVPKACHVLIKPDLVFKD